MKILLIFTLYLISEGGALTEVTGYSGGGIFIGCKYDKGYEQEEKYFCKGSWPGCDDKIKTGIKKKWFSEGRFSLYDDISNTQFTVQIRNLNVKDSGMYQCGIDRGFMEDIYNPVDITVKEGIWGSTEMTAQAGEEINMKCRYDHKYAKNIKYFCRIGLNHWCFDRIKAEPNSEWKHKSRLSVHDDSSAGFFSVIIRELVIEDTGTYWCIVIVSDLIQISTYLMLNVREGSPAVPTQPSSSSSSTDLLLRTPPSPPAAFPVSTPITVSVGLVGLLIGISFIAGILAKRRKNQVSVHKSSGPGSGSKPEVPLPVCDYEEKKDTRRLSGSDTATLPVYATAQRPTIPSDTSQAVYATAQRPTIPSDEGPTYASVSFLPKTTKSADAGPRMIFIKEEEGSCDYAAVRHVTSCD